MVCAACGAVTVETGAIETEGDLPSCAQAAAADIKTSNASLGRRFAATIVFPTPLTNSKTRAFLLSIANSELAGPKVQCPFGQRPPAYPRLSCPRPQSRPGLFDR